MVTNVTHRIAWSIAEIAGLTGLSIGFIRKEISAGNLAAQKKGRRVLVLDNDLQDYLNKGAKNHE
jgi:excisionase family DNA binding protein